MSNMDAPAFEIVIGSNLEMRICSWVYFGTSSTIYHQTIFNFLNGRKKLVEHFQPPALLAVSCRAFAVRPTFCTKI